GGMAEPFGGGYSYPDFRDYQNQNKVFSDLLAFSSASVDLSNGAETKRIEGMVVSSNYFNVLDVKPVVGRTFLPEEDRTPNTYPVTILGFDLWQRCFSADPNVVGKSVTLNGRGFMVVGIAPKGFKGTDLLEPCEIWAPLAMYAQVIPNVLASFADRDIRWLKMIGRLKPEFSLAQAQAELDVLARQLALAYPKENQEAGVRLAGGVGLEPWVRAGARDFPGRLMGVVGLVFQIACGNVANLLLARATTQQKEIAIRLTLGARGARLIRQLLTESMLLSLLGGALGLCVTWWAADLLLAYLHTKEFLMLNASPDARVLGFALFIAIFSGVAF